MLKIFYGIVELGTQNIFKLIMIKLTGIELEKKILELTIIKKDDDNWKIYYVDTKTNKKWVKEYPDSDLHAGGVPTLTLIEKFPWEK